MGEVVDVGPVSTLKKGQRVVVPFTISCGSCFHCNKKQYSACDYGNPAANHDIAEKAYGHPMAGLFGYSHMTGGYSGGQAEYVRVPFSDVGPIVIPDGIFDDKVLFLSDILPSGWMAAKNCDIEPGDTVAVWGCGPGGIGPDAVIDAVGLEAHGRFADNVVDQIKVSTFLGTDRIHAIRQAIIACRKGGRVSYGGFVDKFPLGHLWKKESL